MRTVGIDLGERRIGIATSDSAGVLATPHGVVVRSGDRAADRLAVAAVVKEVRGELVVVGLPLTLAGERGTAAIGAEAEAEALAAELDVPVALYDERLTTVEAERRRRAPEAFRAPGGERARRRAKQTGISRSRKVPVDAVAATVLLQSWLDARRGAGAPPGVLGRTGEARDRGPAAPEPGQPGVEP